MKANICTGYGSPSVIHFQEVATPTPQDNQVLIKIHAASVNPLDWHIMRASPFIVRLGNGLFKPNTTILGSDIAGEVVAVGSQVTAFKVGDAVMGALPIETLGGFAEYVCTLEKYLVLKPAALSFEEAAAVPVAAITAYQGLVEVCNVKSGQKVLINGASGGVGTFAVQIAKALGATVIGVCSTRNIELVRSLGADQVIDYTQTDFSKNGERYDCILELVGNCTVPMLQGSLAPQGIASVIGFTTLGGILTVAIMGGFASKQGGQQIRLMGTASLDKEKLTAITALIERGKIKPVIDARYPLEKVAEAIGYLEKGRARGKVVITVH